MHRRWTWVEWERRRTATYWSHPTESMSSEQWRADTEMRSKTRIAPITREQQDAYSNVGERCSNGREEDARVLMHDLMRRCHSPPCRRDKENGRRDQRSNGLVECSFVTGAILIRPLSIHSIILHRPRIVQTFRILRFESCWHNSLKYMLDTDRHRCTDGAYYANRGEQTKPSGMKAYNQYSQGQTYSTSRVNGTFSSGTSKRKMAGVKKYANR